MWQGIRSVCRSHSGLRLALYARGGKLIGGCNLAGLVSEPVISEPGAHVRVAATSRLTQALYGAVLIVDAGGPFRHGAHTIRVTLEIPPSVFSTSWKFFGAYILLTQAALFFLGFILFHRTVIGPIGEIAALAKKGLSVTDYPTFVDEVKLKGDVRNIAGALKSMVLKIVEEKENAAGLVEKLRNANKELEALYQGLVRTEKLAGIGRLAAGMAHEIGNPLQIVMGYVEFLQLRADEKSKDVLRRMDQELKRIHEILRRLLDFARPAKAENTSTAINTLVADCVSLVKDRKGFSHCAFVVNPDAHLTTIRTQPEKVRQALINLVFNSADAIPESGGVITISTLARADGAEIRVEDTGCGIPKDELPRVFDPFYTSKEPGKGTGLGLAICLGLMDSLGGDIVIGSEPGVGTAVTIYIPDTPAPCLDSAETPTPSERSEGPRVK
jgi:signal transduction histidine kinase